MEATPTITAATTPAARPTDDAQARNANGGASGGGSGGNSGSGSISSGGIRAPRSLAAKLTVWYLISTFLLIFATAALLYVGLRRSLSHEDDLFLGHLIATVRELLANLLATYAKLVDARPPLRAAA